MQTPRLQRVLICRSNPVAPDPRVEKLAEALCKANYEVLVLAWDRTGQLPREEERSGYRIVRFSHISPYGSGLKNIFKQLSWQFFLLRRLIQEGQGLALIHICDFDTLLPCLLSKALGGKRIIYDIFDLYADSRRNIPTLIRKLLHVLEFKALEWVDAVILADESRREQIAGTRPRRLITIYNSPPDVLDTLRRNGPPPRLTELYLVYVGLLQVERGLLEMMEILGRHPEWHLDLAGFGGGDEERILGLARSLPNVTWHGPIIYKRALKLSYAADVLIATYDPTIPNHRYSSPNKVFEAMMLAKPVVVARNTGIDRLVEKINCGLVVPYGDVAALEAALIRLARDPALRQQLGENGRRAYEEKYSWNLMRERLLALYRELSI
ncbi:glycosyltransferase family 4 protein [Neomoorella thermoacetica]|uniref:glycosyltransferase family 4 protein n=1 Tax=Neomoorella thermoacetica TaxID=1525 RepID=UPI0008FB3B03|nr:glycosyltransferase family 4 protein [Moorella thermoacetica]OIQ53517.1 alpha-D-kanosaminyltransferase [Moorella thermoacetica]